MYKVKSGDTLGKIADEFQLPIKTLKEVNNLKDDKIFVGAELKIPNVNTPASER
jgi:LysM repeat protein